MEHEHPHTVHHATTHQQKADLSIPLAIILAGVIVGGAIFYSPNTGSVSTLKGAGGSGDQQVVGGANQVPAAELALRAGDHIRGNPNADVLIIEYSDTECPFCKGFHPTMVQVMDQHRTSGDVAWVYRHFPLDQIHPKARKEAEALECAAELGGNDAFWKYVDKIFEVTPGNNGLDLKQLPAIAGEIGIDVAQFNTCLASGKYADHIQKDFESGVNIGVRGTPYSIIWNKKTGKQTPINGALHPSIVKGIVSTLLASEVPATK